MRSTRLGGVYGHLGRSHLVVKVFGRGLRGGRLRCSLGNVYVLNDALRNSGSRSSSGFRFGIRYQFQLEQIQFERGTRGLGGHFCRQLGLELQQVRVGTAWGGHCSQCGFEATLGVAQPALKQLTLATFRIQRRFYPSQKLGTQLMTAVALLLHRRMPPFPLCAPSMPKGTPVANCVLTRRAVLNPPTARV